MGSLKKQIFDVDLTVAAEGLCVKGLVLVKDLNF